MRHRIIASLGLVVWLVTLAVPVWAHHGTGVAYVRDKEVTLKGTVTEWFWAKPHCGLLCYVRSRGGMPAAFYCLQSRLPLSGEYPTL
jgi:hypothetical protein